MKKIKKIKFCLADKSIKEISVELSDVIKNSGEQLCIQVNIDDKTYRGTAYNYFEALQILRKELEKDCIQILCNGAVVNVYPSPMIMNMGDGIKAYKLYLGKQAALANLINIFDYEYGLSCCSVAEQKAFYKEWLNSLDND